MSKKAPKIVVYTAIINNYDELIDNQARLPNVDYVCFTDNKSLQSNLWDIKFIDRVHDNPVLEARLYKIKFYEFISSQYDYVMWIDGNFEVVQNFTELISNMNHGVMTFDHSKCIWDSRNCVYDEFKALVRLKKDVPKVMIDQIDKYKKEGYPKNNGLVSTGVLIRKNNDQTVINFMDNWFNELKQHSIRDQLSFNYVSWKYNYKFDLLKFDIRDNKYFKMKRSHNK